MNAVLRGILFSLLVTITGGCTLVDPVVPTKVRVTIDDPRVADLNPYTFTFVEAGPGPGEKTYQLTCRDPHGTMLCLPQLVILNADLMQVGRVEGDEIRYYLTMENTGLFPLKNGKTFFTEAHLHRDGQEPLRLEYTFNVATGNNDYLVSVVATEPDGKVFARELRIYDPQLGFWSGIR